MHTTANRWLAFCPLLLTLACATERGKRSEAPLLMLPSASHSQECSQRVSELRSWMQAVDNEGDAVVPSVRTVPTLLVVNEKGTGWGLGRTLSLNAGTVRIDNDVAGSLAQPNELAASLRALRLKDVSRAPALPPLLWLAPTDLWSDIVVALDAVMKAGYNTVTFAFERRSSIQAPPETESSRSARVHLQQTPRERARVDSEQALLAKLDVCPPLRDAMNKIGSMQLDPEQKNAEITQRIPEAIARCQCAIDIGEIKAWHWTRHNRYEGALRADFTLGLAVEGTPKSVMIAAERSQRWSDVNERMIAASKPLQRVVLLLR
jgi:hypothetical protein